MKRERRGAGSWTRIARDRWRYRFTVAGTRRSVTARTQDECRHQAEAIVAEERKRLPSTSTDTLAVYLEHWLHEREREGRLRPRTIAAYRGALTHSIASIGSKKLRDLTHRDVERMTSAVLAGGASSRTANMARTVLGTALKDAERDELIARNPVSLARSLPKPRASVEPLSPEQVTTFLEATRGSRWHPLYVIALALGLRQGELLALRWEDVEHGRVRISHTLRMHEGLFYLDPPKTSASRTSLPMPRIVAEALEQQREIEKAARIHADCSWATGYDDLDLVFRTSAGRPVDGRILTKQFQRDLRLAGLPRRRFHDLRHTCATFLLAQGVDIKVIQEVLRHSTISVTANSYLRVSDTLMREALERLWDADV